MGIVIKEFDGSLVTPKDAAVMNELIFQSYGIFSGCNISFLGVNKIMIASGRMIVKGRQVVITEETIAAQLSSGGTKRGRLYMKIDLSNLDNPGTFLTQVADELPELIQQDDVNYSNGIFEVELCNYDVSETAISNIVETCPMITGSVDLLKSIEEVMANTKEGKAVDALVIKKLNSNLIEQPQFVYDEKGKITGYTTKIGGADAVFPFNNEISIPIGTMIWYRNTDGASNIGQDIGPLDVSKYSILEVIGASILSLVFDSVPQTINGATYDISNVTILSMRTAITNHGSGNGFSLSSAATITLK